MKIFTQMALIMLICLVGEILAAVIPFPIPATILALIVLFLLLKLRILKLSMVEDAGNLLLRNMTIFFVPAGVKLMNYFDLIKDVWLKLVLMIIATTCVVFLVTAYTVKGVLLVSRRKAL